MRKMKALTAGLLLLVLVFTAAAGCGEGISLNALLSGQFDDPVNLVLSEPQYQRLAQFGKERLEMLNRLAKHISVGISLDGQNSETTISVDQDAAYSVRETTDGKKTLSVYSFEPATVYESRKKDEQSVYSAFLDEQFFYINRMLDDLFPVFEKTAAAFGDRAKTDKANINYSGFGKGVKRTTIQLQADYVQKNFPKALADLAETKECRKLLKGLVFSGPQKIILLYDQDGRMIRVMYNGNVGLSADTLRKVSVTWRCLRTKDHRKDNLSLKTPSVKGYDKYNLSYERDLNLAEEEKNSLSWKFELDLRAGDLKKKIEYTADLAFQGKTLQGKIQFTDRHDGVMDRTIIVPEIRKEKKHEYDGTLEITTKTGTIVTSGIKTRIHIAPRGKLTAADAGRENSGGAGKAPGEELQQKMNAILVRRLLALPAEDLGFLRTDIPEDDWNSLLHSLI